MSTRSPSGTVATSYRFDRFQDWSALTRQRGLLDLQRRGHEQTTVRRNLVARLEDDDVARHELLRGDVHKLAITPRMSPDDEHLLKRGDALGRLALLVQAKDGIEHGQTEDHETRRELLQRNDADDRGAKQHELHQVAVLAQKRLPPGLLLRLGELIRAYPLTAAPDLDRLESMPRVDAELLARPLRRQTVPCSRLAWDVQPHRLGHPGAHENSDLRDDDT